MWPLHKTGLRGTVGKQTGGRGREGGREAEQQEESEIKM